MTFAHPIRHLLIFFLLCPLAILAQPTWQLDETTLLEYDLVTGVNVPWDLVWGPDDMLWCTTRHGEVLHIDPSTGAYQTVLELDVYGGFGEPGLLGMAMHPDWDNNPSVFLVYTAPSQGNGAVEHLSAFQWDGESLLNETILHTVDAGGIHNGSRLLILPDSTLLMTTGDTGDGGYSSQSDSHDNGKVLRMNLDGSIPEDNPDPASRVYSKGHRNSQGLCLGPNQRIYSSEHGQQNWDELNVIEPGRNYGWPDVEGSCDTPGENDFCTENSVMEPLATWSPCPAVNGLAYYTHDAIPEWNGALLMAVLGGIPSPGEPRLSVLHLSEDGLGVTSETQHFGSFVQRVRDVEINPHTGAVYLAFNGPQYPGNGPNIIKEFRPAPTSATGEWSGVRGVDAFPNPATDLLRFHVDATWNGREYQVWNAQGQLVTEGILEENLQLSVEDWKRGAYIFTTSSGSKSVLSRLLILE